MVRDLTKLVADSGINLGDIEGVKKIVREAGEQVEEDDNLLPLRIEAFNWRASMRLLRREAEKFRSAVV